ncbi:PREDICTED: uncharacterized protein LOC108561897 [Nicrophorus vespilloides]|uniref:Uncharacterized protein LOC108561897 n=1 Tax=Nicrophorus vespilloides TaxID=110193 RepID=A0ABM1MLQ1_NICVS|nr:PREDICTED: uncharacterized protein LOC108561897 [Nicrophorus vespilloides]
MMLLLFLLLSPVQPQHLSSSFDVRTLSELPMSKLLKVKNTFELNDVEEVVPKEELVLGVPMALKRILKNPLKRGDYGGVESADGKKGMQSVFQMSVTTLAFLAFGGYLLCLIVQSLKGKGKKVVMMMIPVSSTMASVTMANLRRRRRRRRRPLKIRRPRPKRETHSDPETDEDEDDIVDDEGRDDFAPDVDPHYMFDALVHLSEAYTQYHTTNYRHLNQTFLRFRR